MRAAVPARTCASLAHHMRITGRSAAQPSAHHSICVLQIVRKLNAWVARPKSQATNEVQRALGKALEPLCEPGLADF